MLLEQKYLRNSLNFLIIKFVVKSAAATVLAGTGLERGWIHLGTRARILSQNYAYSMSVLVGTKLCSWWENYVGQLQILCLSVSAGWQPYFKAIKFKIITDFSAHHVQQWKNNYIVNSTGTCSQWSATVTRRVLWFTIININKHRQTFISRIQLTLHLRICQVSMQQSSQIIRLLNHNACSHHQQATTMKLDGEKIRDGLTANSSPQIPSLIKVERKQIKV